MKQRQDKPWAGVAIAGHQEPPPIDDRLSARLDSLRKSFRRDLPDQIEAVFQEACVIGELTVAEDLLRTLEAMQARAGQSTGGARGRPRIQVDTLREMLEYHRHFQRDPHRDPFGEALSNAD